MPLCAVISVRGLPLIVTVWLVLSVSVVTVRTFDLVLQLSMGCLVSCLSVVSLLSYLRYSVAAGRALSLKVRFGLSLMMMVDVVLVLLGNVTLLGIMYSCLLKCTGWHRLTYVWA